ncbi:MAG: hypothetical protein AAFO91_09980, partial [Bacteroidota bacterium]
MTNPPKPKTTFLLFCYLLLLASPIHTLDFYFFQKFYNQGHCKSKSDLKAYRVLSDGNQVAKDRMVELALPDASTNGARFAVYLTRWNKGKLRDAHDFYRSVLDSLPAVHRLYFPDLVSCVMNIPFFSLFGLRDSFGLMYRLSPTFDAYVKTELSGNALRVVDVVHVYLDLFKAAQVMGRHHFFLRTLTRKDIGVIEEVKGNNLHLRGKFRRFHNLRSSKRCKPENMDKFGELLESLENWKKLTDTKYSLDLSHPNICFVSNLCQLWDSFLTDAARAIHSTEVEQINACIHTESITCPKELDLLWTDEFINRNLTRFTNAGLMYRGDSIVQFLIYHLEKLKSTLILREVGAIQKKEQEHLVEIVQTQTKFEVLDSEIRQIEDKQVQFINKAKSSQTLKDANITDTQTLSRPIIETLNQGALDLDTLPDRNSFNRQKVPQAKSTDSNVQNEFDQMEQLRESKI